MATSKQRIMKQMSTAERQVAVREALIENDRVRLRESTSHLHHSERLDKYHQDLEGLRRLSLAGAADGRQKIRLIALEREISFYNRMGEL